MMSLSDFAQKHGATVLNTYSASGQLGRVQHRYSRATLLMPNGQRRRVEDVPGVGWQWRLRRAS